MTVYDILKDAIVNKKQVFFDYDEHGRGACPHVIGTKNGEQKVLVRQFAGFTSAGLVDPDGEWKCLFIDKIENLRSEEGEWHTGPEYGHTKPQTCVDEIDVEVDY